jgi:hypothetical protein
MKRVQVILEAWQHSWLSGEANRHSLSLSALLRQLLTEAIERRQTSTLEQDPLLDVIGIAEGPDDGITSENLDQFLYRPNWSDQSTRLMAEPSPAAEAYEPSNAHHR